MAANIMPTLTKGQFNSLMKIADVEAKISEKLPALLDAMLDLAMGHAVQITRFDKNSGEIITQVYDQPPDYKALAFLIENVIGKVPQRVEMTGDGGGPVQVISWMHADEATKLGLRQQLLATAAAAGAGSDSASNDDDDEAIEGESREVSDDE